MFNVLKSKHFTKREEGVNEEQVFTALIFQAEGHDTVTLNTTHDTSDHLFDLLNYGDVEKLEKLKTGFYQVTYTYRFSYCAYLNEGDVFTSILSIKPVDLYAKNNAIPQEGLK